MADSQTLIIQAKKKTNPQLISGYLLLACPKCRKLIFDCNLQESPSFRSLFYYSFYSSTSPQRSCCLLITTYWRFTVWQGLIIPGFLTSLSVPSTISQNKSQYHIHRSAWSVKIDSHKYFTHSTSYIIIK